MSDTDIEFVRNYDAAWRRVRTQIEMSDTQYKAIKKILREHFNEGVDRVYREARGAFELESWKWPELDETIILFQQHRKMPAMLMGCYDESITTELPEFDGIISWFKVVELKEYCKEAGIKAQGKREDIIDTIRQDGRFARLWSQQIKCRYKEILVKKLDAIEKNRAIVLLHYVVMTYYGIEKVKSLKDAIKRNPQTCAILSISGGDNAESWFASQVEQITDEVYPPFFPGDRTALLWVRKPELVPDGKRVVPTAWS